MPPAPILVTDVFDDARSAIDRVIAHAPYWNQARYLPAGRIATATAPPGHPLARADGSAPPVFRGDWYYAEPLVDGVEGLLGHPSLMAAARELFGGQVAVPHVLHVNLTAPGPAIDGGHTDVPFFRGLDRRHAPGWLLLAMARSGLFDRWWIPTATGVAWLYEGVGGGFTYWPDGPDAPWQTHTDLWNTALVGDNDRMYHRVESVGSGPALRLSSDSMLRHRRGRRFELVDADRVVAELDIDELRVSMSWKALVFADGDDHARFVDGTDDLDLDEVHRVLSAALAEAGFGVTDSTGVTDPEFAEAVATLYPRRSPAAAPTAG